MFLTAKILKDKGACEEQVALFEKYFPKGGKVTVEKCVKVAHLFNFDWAAQNLFLSSASVKYEKARAPASAKYEKARASASAKYKKATAPASSEYAKARASAWAKYK